MNKNLFSLEGKTAIVTGAAGYLGSTFTETLLAAGAKVDIYGRGQQMFDYKEFLIKKYGESKVDFHKVDLYDEKKYRSALKDSIEKNKTIDILINNAYEFSKLTGFNDDSGRMENISKKQWIRSLECGVYWAALSIQIVGEKMISQGFGNIINISSMYGIVSPDPVLYKGSSAFNPPAYSSSKAALLALTRYTASFYGSNGVRCNSLAPGAFPNVDTNAYNSPDEKILNRLASRTALKRYGHPSDLVGPLLFLASDESKYMTGQVLVIDGGWTIT